MRRCASMVLLCLFVGRAEAQQGLPLTLAWQAPRECPSGDDVRAALERIAHARPGLSLTPLAARAAVHKRGRDYVTTLHTEQGGRHGERKLEARDCTTLMQTVTLVLALSFGAGVELVRDASAPVTSGPSAVVGDEADQVAAASTEPTRANETPSAGRGGSDEADVSTPNDVTSRGLPRVEIVDKPASYREPARYAVLAGAGARFAMLPHAALSVHMGLERAQRRWSVGLHARGLFARDEQPVAQVRSDVTGWEAALHGCARWPLYALTGSLCAGAHAALLHGSSTGLTQGEAQAPWYALSTGLSLDWPHEHYLRVRADARVLASLTRPRFAIDGVGTVHRVSTLLPEVGLSLVFVPRLRVRRYRQPTSDVSTTTSSK